MKKYKLGPRETISSGGTFVRVHRVIALIDIPAHDVKVGDTGGWVESRRTLSHEGNCWVGGDAVVADGSRVADDALVTGNASLVGACGVSGAAIVKDNAVLSGSVIVRDNASVSGKTNINSPYYIRDVEGYTSRGPGYEISDNVQITGSPKISGSGSISGRSTITGSPKIAFLTMSGDSAISGQPTVNGCILEDSAQIHDSAEVWRTKMGGKTKIYEQAFVSKGDSYTLVTDNAKIFGNARISGAKDVTVQNPTTALGGDVSVYGNSIVREGCQLSGTTVINEAAHLLEYCNISGNSRVSGPAPLPPRYKASDMTQDSSGIRLGRTGITKPLNTNSGNSGQTKANANYIGAYGASPISSALKRKSSTPVVKTEEVKLAAKSIEPIRLELAEIVANVEKDYDTYKNDVVKLIKYPTMVDLKDELTLNFTFALRKAKREISFGQNAEKMEESVETLERAFLAAESNAQKIGPSNYSDHEVKKTNTAKQMLAVALDEEASENERRVSFKQAFKILEGIIAVPDTAIETMKIRVGLKELEA